MKKINEKELNELMKETIGSDYLEQLGLSDYKENNDIKKEEKTKEEQPISSNVKTPTLEETLKLDMTIPTF